MNIHDIIAAVTLFVVTLILVISVPANAAILYVFYKDKKARVASSVFVVNLAIVGLLGAGVFGLLAPSLLTGQILLSVSRAVCLAREFCSELFISVTLFSLMLVTANRYGVIVLRHRYKVVFSNRRCMVYVALYWIVSLCYAASLTVYQLQNTSLNDFKCNSAYSFPRNVAALQFAFLAIPFTSTLALNGAVAFKFHQQRNSLPLPLKFYSQDSMERRMAPGKNRRITKNLRVIAMAVTSLLFCFTAHFACLVFAMFTGKCPRVGYALSITMVYTSCLLHPYLYGYLNRRLKQPLRRIAKRMRNRVLCRYRSREATLTRVDSNASFSTSKLLIVTDESFINGTGIELTRSKMAIRHN